MSKKLLSVLVVLALALSMVPVVGLPATEAKAAVNHTANLEDADGDATNGMQAVCPVCGGEAVTWTVPNRKVEISTAGNYHYYLTENWSTGYTATNFLTSSVNNVNVCFHLNGQQIELVSRLLVNSNTKTLNVIAGNGGGITFGDTGSGSSLFAVAGGGLINIYGGTYNQAGNKPIASLNGIANIYDATINGTLTVTENKRTATLHGSTSVKLADFSALTGSNLTAALKLADGWSGTIEEYKWSTASNFIVNNSGWIHANNLSGSGVITGTIENLVMVKNENATQGTRFAPKAVIIKSGSSVVGYNSATEAAAAYTEDDFTNGKAIKVFADTALALNGDEYYVDAYGKDVNVTGTGTLYPMNTANDTYAASNVGEWTIPETGVTLISDVTNGNRYITIEEGEAYTTHRLEMAINTVTLKTSNAGIYFKASYKCDATLAAKVSAYGVGVSKSEITGKVGEAGIGYSELEGFATNMTDNTVTGNSGAVINILKDTAELDGETNLDRAATDIYAKSYIKIGDDVFMGEENIGCSLQDVLQKAYANGQAEAVNTFVNGWTVKDENITAGNLGLTE